MFNLPLRTIVHSVLSCPVNRSSSYARNDRTTSDETIKSLGQIKIFILYMSNSFSYANQTVQEPVLVFFHIKNLLPKSLLLKVIKFNYQKSIRNYLLLVQMTSSITGCGCVTECILSRYWLTVNGRLCEITSGDIIASLQLRCLSAPT